MSKSKEFYQIVGEEMRKLRLKKCITADELGAMVGLSGSTIAELESGKRKINLYTWCQIMRHIDDEFDFMS